MILKNASTCTLSVVCFLTGLSIDFCLYAFLVFHDHFKLLLDSEVTNKKGKEKMITRNINFGYYIVMQDLKVKFRNKNDKN